MSDETNNRHLELLKVDVNEHTEKKQNLTYLSWAWAWAETIKRDAAANYKFQAPQMFGETMMIFCDVTIFGKTITAYLPVMDHKNKAIPNPDSFAVNKAMMRCLAKGIALHGLGLYIYAGEDLPESDDDKRTSTKKPAKPPIPAVPADKLTPEQFASKWEKMGPDALQAWSDKYWTVVEQNFINDPEGFDKTEEYFSDRWATLKKEGK